MEMAAAGLEMRFAPRRIGLDHRGVRPHAAKERKLDDRVYSGVCPIDRDLGLQLAFAVVQDVGDRQNKETPRRLDRPYPTAPSTT